MKKSVAGPRTFEVELPEHCCGAYSVTFEDMGGGIMIPRVVFHELGRITEMTIDRFANVIHKELRMARARAHNVALQERAPEPEKPFVEETGNG